jgi:dipeptidyl aminopeptidase/acylaminoacyl peptidase
MMPRAVTAVVLGAVLGTVGCGDSSGPEEPAALEIVVDGRIERSSEAELTAYRDGVELSPADVAWSASPTDAVEFTDPNRARFNTAGGVTLVAMAGSRTGSRLLDVAVPPTIVFDRLVEGARDIFAVELDGQNLRRLTTHVAYDENPTAASGVVVFTSFRDGNGELYSVPLAGGPASRLTDTEVEEIDPALSADGARLAFVRGNQEDGLKVWVSAADLSNAEIVAPPPASAASVEATPTWSPAATELAFMSTASGNADVYRFALGSTSATGLAVSPDVDVEPAYSPNGTRIAFASTRQGDDVEIYVVDVTGGTPLRITARAGSDSQPAWLPDGRLVFTAALESGTELRWVDPDDPGTIVPIPIDGGSPAHSASVGE